MLLERLLENLSVTVNAFASCHVAHGWRLRLPALDWVTLHYVARGEGEVRDGAGNGLGLPRGTLAVVPPHLLHSLQCGQPPFGEAIAGSAPSQLGGLPAQDATMSRTFYMKHEQEVALKVLRPELGASIGGERFSRRSRSPRGCSTRTSSRSSTRDPRTTCSTT